jgi:hypothetical protein
MSDHRRNKVPERPDHALFELDDEQALAIMEGRSPAVDETATDQAARQLAERLLRESESEPASDVSGGNVVRLFANQPWMRMAAAMLLGILVTSLVTTRMEQTGRDSALASTDVVYLEVYRGAAAEDLPEVEMPLADRWISFVAYPDFTDADSLRVHIERKQTDLGGESIWRTVYTDTLDAGLRDSVVINVRSGLFEPGEYRLRVESQRGDQTRSSMTSGFVVRNRRDG